MIRSADVMQWRGELELGALAACSSFLFHTVMVDELTTGVKSLLERLCQRRDCVKDSFDTEGHQSCISGLLELLQC